MTEYPDKLTYNLTTTKKLRSDLVKFSKGFRKPCYLEVGFNCGYTMASLANDFISLYGVDTNLEMLSKANSLFTRNKIKNTNILYGNSSRIPYNKYDVILIDGNPNYEDLLNDTINALSKNISSDPFIIVYYGYGLTGFDVKKFCDSHFREFMVPVGERDGWGSSGEITQGPEAVACAFDSKMKKTFLNKLIS